MYFTILNTTQIWEGQHKNPVFLLPLKSWKPSTGLWKKQYKIFKMNKLHLFLCFHNCTVRQVKERLCLSKHNSTSFNRRVVIQAWETLTTTLCYFNSMNDLQEEYQVIRVRNIGQTFRRRLRILQLCFHSFVRLKKIKMVYVLNYTFQSLIISPNIWLWHWSRQCNNQFQQMDMNTNKH